MARPSKYSPELRRRAIEEVIERDRAIPDVARDLGIGSVETVRKWVNQARRDAGLEQGPTTEELAEIRRLRKEVADQQSTIEILKAATTFSPRKPTQRHVDVTPIRFHDLRHTHASLLLRDRVPIKVVSERLGHSNPAFTMTTYQHVIPSMQEDAAAAFGQLLANHSPQSPRRRVAA